MYGSVAANCALFALQLAAAIQSGSLALFANMANAFMDVLSGFILLFASRSARKHNLLAYPAGKSRMETGASCVFRTNVDSVGPADCREHPVAARRR